MLAMPGMRREFADQGAEPVGGPPERFAGHLKVQIESGRRWSKESGARVA
jgi:hypothetical protein